MSTKDKIQEQLAIHGARIANALEQLKIARGLAKVEGFDTHVNVNDETGKVSCTLQSYYTKTVAPSDDQPL